MHKIVAPLFLMVLLFSGCSSASKSSTDAASHNLKPSLRMMTTISGYSVEGRPIERWSFGTGDEYVLIIASIHGDEAAGTPLLHRFARHLAANPETLEGLGRVVLVPQVNPDGVADKRRHNSQGVDLNRNFPTSNFQSRQRHGDEPLSQPESRALYDLIQREKPRRVISIHQPVGCIDYDGPERARGLAIAMSEASDLPVQKLGARPGSLGSYVGLELGIPIITLELPSQASRWGEERLWDEYGEMLITSIQF
ncbi:MAG: DUF2817 domain-containing protein [Planctomycetota bacterium]|nr:DUF2817 domain-containing protein [Planctomycetota bacterium]